ncbi:MAG: hypothetical protein AB8F94_13220, partial [Saprospiraceae bacterium]
MNKSIFSNIIFTALLVLIISGCSHETDTFDGPNLVDRFGPFSVVTDLEVSQATVDFAAGETVFFTAEFNKNVNWVLEITGTTSGSVKRFEGFNKSINMTNAEWTGGTTVLPLFKNEVCNVVLTVPEEPSYTGNATIETLSAKSYANEGVMFADFETNYGADVFVGNFEFEFTAQTGRQDDIPAEGTHYFRLEGTDNVVPNFFVGLVDISAQVTGQTYVQVPTTVPEELYFNCFMYSDAGPHGLAIIDFIFDTNNSGAFEDGQDLGLRVPVDYNLATWNGWQQISHPMSDIG